MGFLFPVYPTRPGKTILPGHITSHRRDLYVSHKSRQPQTEDRHIGHDHQYNENRQEIPQQLSEYRFYLNLSYLNTNEQGGSYRRCDGSDTQVEDHHDTEMDGIHTQSCTHRKEDRGENQAGRRHIHKGTYDQQDNIDDKQDHIFVIADR